MVNVLDFKGNDDSQRIEQAIAHRDADGIVVIPPRSADAQSSRTHWLIDRTILLPENTTIVLQNCRIKLSDRCRDNFFRSANCGLGIEENEPLRNIHIRGEGYCVLEGADHPRAVGDGSKLLKNPCPYEKEDLLRLADWIPEERKSAGIVTFGDRHNRSFGTDAGRENESQYGDWRGVGILLAAVEHFSIENISMIDTHGWAISLEACTHGRVQKIHFEMTMSKEIDGLRQNMENQDGINLRNGCSHIIVSDITGRTGDDVVALTAIANPSRPYKPGGSLRTTHVMHNDWTRRDPHIHDIIVRNVAAYSNICLVVGIRPIALARIWNVVVDGIIDTSPDPTTSRAVIQLGEPDHQYGVNEPDAMKSITISNVISNSQSAILVKGILSDSVIANVVQNTPDRPVMIVERENGLNNVQTSNFASK